MKVLITGGSGLLGSELKKLFDDSLTPSHHELDISDAKQVKNYFKTNDIDVVIHTAAITSIRKCEEEKESAWKTNVIGTRNIIDNIVTSSKKIKFVYVSTACVFDGHKEMYDENSIPHPENFYGLTKLLGEYETSRITNPIIIRTNFVGKKIWPYPAAFSDRYGTYLFAEDVAKGILEIINSDLSGTIHLVGDKKMSMYDLAKITTPQIQSITIKSYSGPKLTMDMSLDSKRWKKYTINSY